MISLKLPMDKNVLHHASIFLKNVAVELQPDLGTLPIKKVISEDLKDSTCQNTTCEFQGGLLVDGKCPSCSVKEKPKLTNRKTGEEIKKVGPGEYVKTKSPAPPPPDLGNDSAGKEREITHAEIAQAKVDAVNQPLENVNVTTAVELDSLGLPWDSRINPISKLKIQTGKKKGQWKISRNKEPELVEKVRGELSAAMLGEPLIDAGDTVSENAEITPTTPTSTTVPSAKGPAAPPVDANSAITKTSSPSEITTAPGLFSAITAKGVAAAAVMEVAKKNGLASIALITTRPDLIPSIAKQLGL